MLACIPQSEGKHLLEEDVSLQPLCSISTGPLQQMHPGSVKLMAGLGGGCVTHCESKVKQQVLNPPEFVNRARGSGAHPLIGWNLVQSDRGVTVTGELRNRPQEFCIPARRYGNTRAYRTKLLGVMLCSKLATNSTEKTSEHCKHRTTSITNNSPRTFVPFHLYVQGLSKLSRSLKGKQVVYVQVWLIMPRCASVCTVPGRIYPALFQFFLLSMSVI